MTPNQETALKLLLDERILIIEINQLAEARHAAVREGAYEDAIMLRDAEEELLKKLPSLDEIKQIRAKLNGSG